MSSDEKDGKHDSSSDQKDSSVDERRDEKKRKSETKDKEKNEKKSKKDKDAKKKKKKNKKQSRSRSRSRSGKRHSKKRRSRSRSESKKKRKNQKSRKRKSESSSRSRSRTRTKSREHKKTRSKSVKKSSSKSRGKGWRFDSPPKNSVPVETAVVPTGVTAQPEVAANPVQTLLSGNLGLNNLGLAGLKDISSADLLKLQLLQNAQASKSDRKLYVGNLPPNLTPQTLMDVLNSALQKMNVNTNPGNSIVTAWISADGHYGFVEFRTPEETTNGFALNNVAIFGQPLKVGRPKNYVANNNLSANLLLQGGLLGMNPLTSLLSTPALGGQPAATTLPNNNVVKVHPPSRILVLKNIIQLHELEIDEEYNEIKEDVKEECSKYGLVNQVKIPRPAQGENVPGLGKVFVEFSSVEEAKEARKGLTGMTFSNHTVECSYHDEAMFAVNNFNEPN